MSIADTAARIRARLTRRADAYRALFLRPDKELAVPAEIVLRDLARYCYATRPTLKVSPMTGQADPIAMAFAEGRRDVLNRIIAQVNLTDEQINRISTRGQDE